jgi:drug/metabolite transporter (DMT)-like permease
MVSGDRRALALIALFAGATAIASSALFVKVSETGPVSTAFWRVFLALPVLWAWALAGGWAVHVANYRGGRGLMWAAGLFFVGDLAVWHFSILLTSVTNATLLANLAPIFVTLAAWLLFRQTPTGLFLTGLAFALAGMALLIGSDFQLAGSALLGNILGVVTAMFYAGYQMVVTRLRAGVSTASIMAWSSAITTLVLLPLALASGEHFWPVSAMGWIKLSGLALVSQVAGQSLIAYAMAHLPATMSSVGLLLQPVIAALLAAVLLGEALQALQIAGGVMMLAGIGIAHQGRRRL